MTNRIKPFLPGGDITKRIDEIVLTGATHLEMLDDETACLWIGNYMFSISAGKRRQLIVALRDWPGDGVPTAESLVADQIVEIEESAP